LVLERVLETGRHVVVATGRPPRFVGLLVGDLGVADLAICCNGALVYDMRQRTIVEHSPCSPATAHSIISELRRQAPEACFAFERGLHFACEPEWLALAPPGRKYEPQTVFAKAEELCTEPVTKLLVRHPSWPFETLLACVQGIAGDVATVTHAGSSLIEISAAGVHKGQALEALCGRLKIERSEVVAFGDMPNDLAMLTWAGHAIAVGNAHQAVRELVSDVTLSNDEDGVALALERLLRDAW
jgi:Cof subfamily protein (haloacid dehalogenase superfamily)